MFENKTGNNSQRQALCALATFMDDGIGNITRALTENDMMTDTIFVYTNDNGGPSNNQGSNWASNYPLRAGKGMLFEGGVRVPAFITGYGIPKHRIGTRSNMYISSVDWVPTLLHAATGLNWKDDIIANTNMNWLPGDGINQWDAITTGSESLRDTILLQSHNEHDSNKVLGYGIIYKNWKLVNLHFTFPQMIGNFSWLVPPGQNVHETNYTVKCNNMPSLPIDPNECVQNWCLFDLSKDPCEYNNIINKHPDIYNKMKNMLDGYGIHAKSPVVGYGCYPKKILLDKNGIVLDDKKISMNGLNNDNDNNNDNESIISSFAWAPCDLPLPTTITNIDNKIDENKQKCIQNENSICMNDI
jgi:hypothetical protein